MYFSVRSLPLLSTAFILLLQVHQDEATFPIVIGAAAAPILALTAAQVSGLAALAVLTKLSAAAGVAGGLLVAGALNNRDRTRGHSHGRRRGKRSTQELELELDVTLKMLTEMEPEECYKRIICADNTGKFYNQKLDGVMNLISEKSTDPKAAKFLAAAEYGYLVKDLAKCEHRYECSMDMEFIKTYF